MGKLPGGSSKINRLSLNRCPPYTEIFSKRRKIYAVCVESLSMPTHQTKQWVAESCIQIKFVNALFASTKDRLGTKWIRGKKAAYYEMWDKYFRQKANPIVLLTNALCVHSWAIVGEWGGRPHGESFSSRQIINCGNRHERAGWDGKAGSLLTARNWA